MKRYFLHIIIFSVVLFGFIACGEPSVIAPSSSGDLVALKQAIKNGGSIHDRDSSGFTPLHNASDSGRLNIVKYLIQNGADINSKTNAGDTPLIRAAYLGHLNVVNYLLQKGASINSQTNSGVTALITASAYGRINIVKSLVKNGADIKLQTKSGNAYDMSVIRSQVHVTAFFDEIFAKREKARIKIENEKKIKLAKEKELKRKKILSEKVDTLVSNNDFEGLKKLTDLNPNAVYYIKDKVIRLSLTGPKGLKVGDIRKLVKKGRSERIIISLIKRVKLPYKEFSLDEIDILVDLELSDNIISSMIDITTELLKDEQRRKEQEYYLTEQKRIAKENSNTKVIHKTVNVTQANNTQQNLGGNEVLNAVGKEVGSQIGRKLLDSLF